MNLGTEYRRIWAGSAASNLADGIIFVGIPLLALTVTHKPLAIAGLDISYTVPRILAVLGIGVLIDRADRRRLLYLANLSSSVPRSGASSSRSRRSCLWASTFSRSASRA
jgi:MFS family permease